MVRPSKLRVAVSDPGQWLSERERAQVLAPKLRALADETRLTLILLIAQRPRTVKELQEATGLSQTLVSHTWPRCASSNWSRPSLKDVATST